MEDEDLSLVADVLGDASRKFLDFNYLIYPVEAALADKLCGIAETHGGRASCAGRTRWWT